MKSIRKETRLRRIERAMLVIEGLVIEECSDHFTSNGKAPAGWTETKYIAHLQRIVSDIYCIAHASTGLCCEGGNSKWIDMIPRLERALKKLGLIDVAKCLKGKAKY